MKYPQPKKVDRVFNEFGTDRNDPYFWMRDIDNDPEVKELLIKENEITEVHLSSVKELRDTLYEELKGRQLEDYETCPFRHGDYLYYERFEKGKEYAIHCRKHVDTNVEEICIDENILAKDHEYFSMSTFEVSYDHKILCYAVDTKGDEIYTLYFLDLETKELLDHKVENTMGNVAWFNGSYTIAYTLLNDKQRPYKALTYSLADKAQRVLYEEPSGEYFVHVEETLDHQVMLIGSCGSISNEYFFLDANDPMSEVKVVKKRDKKVEYHVDYKEGEFYLVINESHENFSVIKSKADDLSNWTTIIEGNESRYINNFNCFKDFNVLSFKEDGLNKLEVHYNDGNTHLISFPEKAYFVCVGDNATYDTEEFRYDYYSPTTPLTTYDFDIDKKESNQIYQKEVPNFNPEDYKVDRVEVTSHDGALVPMTIMYKKDTKLDGSAPAHLYGYGSYSACVEPWFDSKIFSLVDRGFVFAIAHVRGSSTLGRKWYEDGKFLKKKNTFKDFISCANYLYENNFSSKGNISIQGGSAGGLLMGAVLNMSEPDLFKAIVAEVPFVDMLNTMLDSSLPLTELEYDEWGNPADKEYYDYMKSYSPYDNIEKRDFPSILATGGLNDPRVTYWEPMKWVYKLRDNATNDNPILLHTNMDAGHAGASGRFEYLKEDARTFAFILKEFNLE